MTTARFFFFLTLPLQSAIIALHCTIVYNNANLNEVKPVIEINPKSNLLEEKTYRYTLQDVPEPRLFRDMFPYHEIPKTPFNNRRVPMNMQEDIWITGRRIYSFRQ